MQIRLWRLLAALLNETPHEVLGIGLKDFVDLVEKIVKFRFELLARFRTRRSFVNGLFLTIGWCSSDLFTFRHGTS
jgi:hypothetical protein